MLPRMPKLLEGIAWLFLVPMFGHCLTLWVGVDGQRFVAALQALTPWMLVWAAPLTVAAAKEMVYLATDTGRMAGLEAARHLFDHVYRSEDAQEGPLAFAEKRKPRWKGR